MDYDIIGYTAIGIAAIATIPQLHQICITKKVRDLNFFSFFYVLFLVYYILHMV